MPKLQGGTFGLYQANPVTQVITHVIYSPRHERNRGRPRVWALFIRGRRRRILHSPGPIVPRLPLGSPDRSGGMRSCAFLCATTRYRVYDSVLDRDYEGSSVNSRRFCRSADTNFREHLSTQFSNKGEGKGRGCYALALGNATKEDY